VRCAINLTEKRGWFQYHCYSAAIHAPVSGTVQNFLQHTYEGDLSADRAPPPQRSNIEIVKTASRLVLYGILESWRVHTGTVL
jgi:hypothetical protein